MTASATPYRYREREGAGASQPKFLGFTVNSKHPRRPLLYSRGTDSPPILSRTRNAGTRLMRLNSEKLQDHSESMIRTIGPRSPHMTMLRAA